jgi:hypothetical protein
LRREIGKKKIKEKNEGVMKEEEEEKILFIYLFGL